MLSSIQNNRKSYHSVILNNIKNNLYRKKRYQLDFALAIAICDTDICMRDFVDNIRQTDKFIVLENNLCLVVLEIVSLDSAIKATSNLESIFQQRYFNKQLFISVVTSTDDDYDNDGYKLINSLLDSLGYSISHDMNHEVIDYYQFESSK